MNAIGIILSVAVAALCIAAMIGAFNVLAIRLERNARQAERVHLGRELIEYASGLQSDRVRCLLGMVATEYLEKGYLSQLRPQSMAEYEHHDTANAIDESHLPL